MSKRSKRYREISQLVEAGKSYLPHEALELVKKTSKARFDETVELSLNTSSDPKKSDQLVRGFVLLPHGTGRQVKIIAFAQGDAAISAKDAGADYVSDDELIKRIQKDGWIDFDLAIATSDMMPKIGKLGPILGRRGLMPNPKTGTVVSSENIASTIKDAKNGRAEFRMDGTAIIHAPIGKVSFDDKKLLDNLSVLIDAVMKTKPSGIKGDFISRAHLVTTMGPSIKLDLPSTLSLVVE